MTVYDLHMYELINFSLKAISGLHCENFCYDVFVPYTIKRETRGSAIKLLKQPLCVRKIALFNQISYNKIIQKIEKPRIFSGGL